MKKDAKKVTTVDEYLEQFSPAVKKTLQAVRKTIRAAAPKAEEVISYGIPGYKQDGMLIFFGGFAKHCSLFGTGRLNLKDYAKELAPFKISGTTIHFTPENPLPASLIKKFVKVRLAQNAEAKAAKLVKKKSKK